MDEKTQSPDFQVEIRKQFITAEKAGIGAMWKTYITLMDGHENSWRYLSAVCMAAEDRVSEVGDGEIVSAYLAMIDMTDSLAAKKLEEPADYHLFCKSRADWGNRFWRIIPW